MTCDEERKKDLHDTNHKRNGDWPVEHAVGSVAVTSASRACTGHGPQAQIHPVGDMYEKEFNEKGTDTM